MSDPQTAMRQLLKARASTDGNDSFTWFTGNVYPWIPGKPKSPVPMLGIEGYNVARAVEVDGGWDLLGREAVFYLDPFRRTPLETWQNPITEEAVKVVHIWNDPVNFPFRAESERGPFRVPTTRMGDDVIFNLDVLMTYPSPLPTAEYPKNSQSDVYEAAELFQFFTKAKYIDDDECVDAPTTCSWTRIGPLLPWMEMGDQQGMLVYHCRGVKCEWSEMPEWIRDKVLDEHPEYRHAPEEFTAPNETSWTYFKKLART